MLRVRKALWGIPCVLLLVWPQLSAAAGGAAGAISAAAANIVAEGGAPPVEAAESGLDAAETALAVDQTEASLNVESGGDAPAGSATEPADAEINEFATDSEPSSADATAAAVACSCGECAADTCSCVECEVPAVCGIYEFFGPQAVINQHPPNLLFYAPVPEAATTLAPGRRELATRLEWTNVIIRELDSGIIADYDYESLRLSLAYKWGTPAGEFSASLPFIYRGHGILDGIIAEWHDWFALPNGLRNKFPDGQYRYVIATREGPVFNDAGDSYGLGDISLGYKYSLFDRGAGRRAMALRAGIKAPLGDSAKALGSGNWDFSAGVLYQQQLGERWRGYASADWVFVGEPDWENIGWQDMLVTNWALEYALRSNTTLTAQFRTQRNPLRIGSREADKDAQELSLGFNHRVADNLVWSGGFNEDLNPETSPDFVINTQLKWEF